MDKATVALPGTDRAPVTGFERFAATCRAHWPADQGRPRVVTRAPGRLDFMGGMADFAGALALQIPIDRGVFVAAGRRDDERVLVESIGWNGGEDSRAEWPLSHLYQSDGQFVQPEVFSSKFSSCSWVRHIAGVCYALVEAGGLPHLAGGVTILLQSDIPAGAGLASSAAIQVATAKALAALFGAELTDYQLLSACRSANHEVVGAQPGLVDHLTCLWGESNALLQIRCQPDDVLGTVNLPADVRIVAIDAGFRLPLYEQRYADNRASSLIGKYLIEALLRQSGAVGDPTGGYLANVAPSEYVRRFRNELPVKRRGQDLLAELGQPDGLDLTIELDRIYKIRSRTEHHIYENDRTHRFMERLSRARRTGERDALIEAGELMYASHWSYGQRCGMGSIETDILVNLIRQRGAARGLYGAKVTAGGCGGSIAVLAVNQPAVMTALQEVCATYAGQTGKQATILAGSSPGAATFGVRTLD
ncbi:MAG TPA: hypothetical protein VLM89_10040 [Phycisphaerae bacterium]|nr:hypothetical protein [Phycisphaerae bacterium]